jgi:hypothetical protein
MKQVPLICQAFLLIIFFMACRKQAINRDVVYLTAAETSNVALLIADSSGGEIAITAKVSQLVTAPVKVAIEIDTSLITTYNQLTGKQYQSLPQGSFALIGNNTVTISPGASLSDAIKLRVLSIKDFKDGVSYLVPVTIKSADGFPILEASKTLYVKISRVVISTVASVTNNYFTVDFSRNNEALKAMNTISYEIRVMANQFQPSSPFISSIMGIEENFLLRFGDVTVQPNQLQVAGGITATNIPIQFSTGVWNHIAAVYNGSQLKVYVNGQLAATKDGTRTVNLTDTYAGGFHFGFSANGRYLDGAISEARIWSKALTQAEISNGMCGVDPASAGLVGYWKFNEGAGNIAHDISGNGHDATAIRSVSWIPRVRCN